MVNYRIVECPAFEIIGKKTWIAGQDNSLFGRFWEECQTTGLFEQFHKISHMQPGKQTNGITLGVSRVEADPNNRSFYYMIAVEKPEDAPTDTELEVYEVPECIWAVFECHGKVPDAIVASEIYAFTQWLPSSGYVHAYAPEMEVYPTNDASHNEQYNEFWLPIMKANKTT